MNISAKSYLCSSRKAPFCLALLFLILLTTAGTAASREKLPDNRVRIQLVSVRQTTLSSELAANIAKLHVKEGETFPESRLLLEYDCSLLNAQANKAEAVAEVARRSLEVNTRLAELNAISTLEVDQTKAKVKETEAEVAAMRVMIDKCSLKAPFTGRIAKLHVEQFQYVTPGKPLMDILDTNNLEVRLLVPSHWLAWLKTGSRFTILIEELGRSYSARLMRIGARIDPLSQSIPLAGVIDGEHHELLPGMSGWATFSKARP